MVGYSTNSPEWLILNADTGVIRKAYSVKFQESKSGFRNQRTEGDLNMPYLEMWPLTESSKETPKTQDPTTPKEDTVTLHPTNGHGWTEPEQSLVKLNSDESTSSQYERESRDSNYSAPDEEEWVPSNNRQAMHSDQRSLQLEVGEPDLSPRKGTRIRRQFNPENMPSGTRDMERLTKEIEEDMTLSDDETSDSAASEPEHLGLCMALQAAEESVPRSWKQALHVPCWRKAMENEIKELQAMKTWELTTRTPEMKVVPGLWRYRVKRDENGVIQKYKARWVMDGSREPFARPPETVYSPVAEMATIRMLFALAATLGHQVLQADFKNAYLNAEMDENIHVTQPYELEEHDDKDKIYLLKRALYGCSVSGKRWNEAISGAIESLGYQRSTIDHCMYARRRGNYRDLLVLYVDDILAFSTQGKGKAESQLDQLEEIYDIKRLGRARHMVGIGIHHKGDK